MIGGLLGAALGGFTGGAFSKGAFSVAGMEAGVCSAAETAKAQKLFPGKADQLLTQSTARLKDLVIDKDLAPSPKPDCQQVFESFKALSK